MRSEGQATKLTAAETRRVSPRVSPAPLPRPNRGPVLFSILVATVSGRDQKLARLLAKLDPQVAAQNNVELIVLRDNRRMSIGEKRNKLVSLAHGDYIAFVDDDDMVAPDYVSSIVGALGDRPDVVVFLVRVEGYGPVKQSRFGLALKMGNHPHEYHRKPNHIMVWRRDLASTVPFPATDFGEDTQWAEEISTRAAVEKSIDRVLYTYQHDARDSASTTSVPTRPVRSRVSSR